jgi:hypothetical protein
MGSPVISDAAYLVQTQLGVFGQEHLVQVQVAFALAV